MATSALQSVVDEQLSSLDDTDCYASAWRDALASAETCDDGEGRTRKKMSSLWGGRGRGGRGLARRTAQPLDVVVEDVSLEYVGGGGAPSRILLDGATLKLLARRVYALVGRNGCGKSTLLRRIDACGVPGFPPHLSTLYVPQEVTCLEGEGDDVGEEATATAMDVLIGRQASHEESSARAARIGVEELEARLEALDVQSEDDQEQIERLCEEISRLEERLEEDVSDGVDDDERRRAADALGFFGIDEEVRSLPLRQLSGGQRKRVLLASALFCDPDVLMLDEPTNHLDIGGIFQVRRLIEACAERSITVVLVSHDVDLINDVATDVINFADKKLTYYPGNYRDFVRYKDQHDLHRLRQNAALEKQRASMLNTIDNLKKQSAGKGGDVKKRRAIESRKKKLERHGIEKDSKGHRWTAQTAGSGIREGSINSIGASKRKQLSHTQLLKQAETKVAPVPDKEVQFKFRDPTSTWGHPLIMAMDVGHGFGCAGAPREGTAESAGSGGMVDGDAPVRPAVDDGVGKIVKRYGMLFDCVDLCIREGSTTFILGANGSGKSTLLKILAGVIKPLEGTVSLAQNVTVCYFDQHVADDLIGGVSHAAAGEVTALSLIRSLFPKKSEQDLRGELTAFGLGPTQAGTNVKFLSGGERCRLCLATLMLRDPQVLILDEASNHLDVESVDALIYGIERWKGTVIMVSHDAHLIRTIGGTCYALVEDEGKLRQVTGGLDSYLKAFALV